MFELDYGLAGSGKSRYIEEVFKQKLNSEDKLMILVPDQHSFITERSVLEHFGVKDGSKIKVIWFNNLARLIIEEYGSVKPKLLDNSGKAVLMSKAINEVSDELEYYKKQASKPDFIASLVNLSAEIKYSKTPLEDLVKAGENSGSNQLSQKLKEIALITGKYDELVESAFLNPDDTLIKINEILEKNKFFEGYTVAVDGFGFFDRQKLDIIGKIIKQSKNTYLTLCTDTLEPSRNEGEKFQAVKKTAKNLIKIAEEAGAEIKLKKFDNLSSLKPEFKALSEGIYSGGSDIYSGECEAVKVYECDNISAECDLAALGIKKLVMQKGYRYKDIALIVRDEDKYIPYLKRSFTKMGIPFFKDERRSITNEPLILFCTFALKAVCNNFRTDDVMACTKSAVTGFDTEEISDFENYCIIWGISGKKKFAADFTYNPNGFTEYFTDEDRQNLEKINALRKRIIIPLLAFAKKVKGADVKTISVALYELLESVNAPENIKKLMADLEKCRELDIAAEQSAVWDALMNCLEQIVSAMGDEVIPLKDYSALLSLALINVKLGVVPQYIDEILVGSADRIRTDMPKGAFLLGVNEGEFPKGFADGGILNDADRVNLLKFGIELGMNCTSMASQERFFAYCAALAPSEYLFVSYNKSNFDGEELSASSLVNEIMRLLEKLEIKTFGDLTADDILSGEQGFEALARMWNDDTSLRNTLYDIYSKDERFSEKLKVIENSLGSLPKKINNPQTAVKLFREIMSISPSQLECYYKCPFMYFCNYALRAKPIEKAGLDERTGGTLIHYVLENFVRDNGKAKIVLMSDEELKNEVDRIIAEYIKTLDLPEEFLSGRFKYIVSKNRKIILKTLSRMKAEMAQSDFKPCDFELRVGSFGVGNYEVDLNKGKVTLGGKVDRIDTMEKYGNKYFRIIDYKTGSKEFKLGEVLHGINAQMLIYLLSLAGDKKGDYKGAVPSGLLYLIAKDSVVSANRSSTDYIASERKKENKMSGMVLGDDVVLHGMEHEPSGEFIPIKIDKNGEIGGNVITAEQMQKLKEQMDKVVANMGNNLHEGNIDDMPVTIGGGYAPCDYCDYKAVCRNKDKKAEAELLSFDEVIKQLDGGEENE